MKTKDEILQLYRKHLEECLTSISTLTQRMQNAEDSIDRLKCEADEIRLKIEDLEGQS